MFYYLSLRSVWCNGEISLNVEWERNCFNENLLLRVNVVFIYMQVKSSVEVEALLKGNLKFAVD